MTSSHISGENISHVALPRALTFQAGYPQGAGAFQSFLHLKVASCIS